MDTFLTCTMLFLMLLACVNLFVGVSNDAVNFLSSALGSRTARYNVVLGVAAAGVLLGCTFSSGMMEIARSGIFNPQLFTFWDVMLIFFAVMLTDVLLLDTFNSLGLPTSTTVSIVFELLGAAVISAAYKLWVSSGSLAGLGAYINNEKAFTIITAILVSVAIAFTFGAVIQWLIRVIFSFKYQKVYRFLGGIYSGLCITAIFYFLIMKGAKGASFMTPELLSFLDSNTSTILWSCFIGVSAVFQLLIWFFNFNALRVVILAGTFALAFAFAGNDLVNFVGVPLAAMQSVDIAVAAKAANEALTPQTLYMGALKESVRTPTIYLVLSGLIMVLTLWFSPKAKRVVQTAINLSASERSDKEQFGATTGGRVMVRSALSAKKILNQLLPDSVLRGIDSRFEKPRLKKGEIALPFDEVRASVNLVLASILIAVATSMKLPLSTTYVTFMVAMGSSLADGAWDRETAVYRISGVMAVISGWFLTGFTAFILAGIAVLLCIWFGPWFMVLGGILVIIRLFKSNFFPKKEKIIETEGIEPGMAREELRLKLNHAIANNLDDTVSIFSTAMTNFLAEDYEELKKTRLRAQGLLDKISYMRSQYYLMFVRGEGPSKDYDARNYYYRTFSNMKDVAQDLRNTLSQMEDHLANSHSVFKGVLRSNLLQALNELTGLEHTLSKYVEAGEISDDILLRLSDTNLEEVNKFQIVLMKQIEEHQMPLHRSELYLSILQLYREIVNRYTVIVLLQRELNFVLSDPDRDNGAPEYAVEQK
ncbi:inorganic phosphate transporter [uncultured Parasutterella sp.]|uniref:inorganic phosphate transporter n=1 Tax=uncultured Parasutterella sp. TaxID=1263098 RepID=UPI002593E181|nr:inorganic phosphate transporter [uncultured Parasutterella sp.]